MKTLASKQQKYSMEHVPNDDVKEEHDAKPEPEAEHKDAHEQSSDVSLREVDMHEVPP